MTPTGESISSVITGTNLFIVSWTMGCSDQQAIKTSEGNISFAVLGIPRHEKNSLTKCFPLLQDFSIENTKYVFFPYFFMSWPETSLSLSLTDINECERAANCQRGRCINILGSYRCECEKGFMLRGRRCEGQYTSSSALLTDWLIGIIGKKWLIDQLFFFIYSTVRTYIIQVQTSQ